MPVEIPAGDLSRTIAHEPNHQWPSEVKVQLIWNIEGRAHVRSLHIDADAFFGTGRYGAPMEGAQLIQVIENLRREGPPVVEKRLRGSGPPPLHRSRRGR